MSKIGYLATFPQRLGLLKSNLDCLLNIFSELRICLNEYSAIPGFLKGDERVKAFLPERDYKDVGKFLRLDGHGPHFLLDDDITYPLDYAERLSEFSKAFSGPVVLGVHGVSYLPGYSGGMSRRRVFQFYAGLGRFEAVDVLGTGTVMLSGFDAPPIEFMSGSAGFVDIRFGRYCAERGVPRICVPRPSCWLREYEHEGRKLVTDVTSKNNSAILAEVKSIMAARNSQPALSELPSVSRSERMRIASSLPIGVAYRSRRIIKKLLRNRSI